MRTWTVSVLNQYIMLGDNMAVGDDATLCFLSTFQREIERNQGSFESRMICTTWLGWLQTRMDEVCRLHFLIKCFEQRLFIPTWISLTSWEISFVFSTDLMLLVRFSFVCELFTLCVTYSLLRRPDVVWNTEMNLSNMQKKNNQSRKSN